MSSGKPLLQSVSVKKLTSQSSLDSEHIINALCIKVLIKLSLRFFGQNESQRIYKPVKLGLRYTLVRKQEAALYTRTSRNGCVELLSFSRVNRREGCILLRWKKFASLSRTTEYTECVINIAEVHIRYRALREQIILMETHGNSCHCGTQN